MQSEVRSYLWATDAYVFPSAYEIFSLAVLQAAAGLPVLVSEHLYGAEEFIRDGDNGWVVSRTEEGVTEGLARLITAAIASRKWLQWQFNRFKAIHRRCFRNAGYNSILLVWLISPVADIRRSERWLDYSSFNMFFAR